MLKLKNKNYFSVIKLFITIFVIVLLCIIIIIKLVFVTSEQAFINTKLVTLRAPIAGVLNLKDTNIGLSVIDDQEIFEITNLRFGNLESNTQYNNLQNLIDVLQLELAQDNVSIKKYESDYSRFGKLKDMGAVAVRDYEDIENKLNVLKVSIENKNQQLLHLKENFKDISEQLELQKRSKVIAPCNAVVWSVLAKDGEEVNIGEEIIQLVNPDDVWVDAFFSERFAVNLSPGMLVNVSCLGSKEKWNGKIIFIRGGSGRVIYNTAVEMPPISLTRRLVAVRIKVDFKGKFGAAEFYGVGRSMVVNYNRFKFLSWNHEK